MIEKVLTEMTGDKWAADQGGVRKVVDNMTGQSYWVHPLYVPFCVSAGKFTVPGQTAAPAPVPDQAAENNVAPAAGSGAHAARAMSARAAPEDKPGGAAAVGLPRGSGSELQAMQAENQALRATLQHQSETQGRQMEDMARMLQQQARLVELLQQTLQKQRGERRP